MDYQQRWPTAKLSERLYFQYIIYYSKTGANCLELFLTDTVLTKEIHVNPLLPIFINPIFILKERLISLRSYGTGDEKNINFNVSFILHTYKLTSMGNLERVNFGLWISYKRRIDVQKQIFGIHPSVVTFPN